jgi:hypothetical protein
MVINCIKDQQFNSVTLLHLHAGYLISHVKRRIYND